MAAESGRFRQYLFVTKISRAVFYFEESVYEIK
jgi:hypothetical protein